MINRSTSEVQNFPQPVDKKAIQNSFVVISEAIATLAQGRESIIRSQVLQDLQNNLDVAVSYLESEYRQLDQSNPFDQSTAARISKVCTALTEEIRVLDQKLTPEEAFQINPYLQRLGLSTKYTALLQPQR